VRSDGIAIGGVGGSGTRLVAGALAAAGYFIGYDLNEASDNLTFSLLFVRREILDASDDEFRRLVALFSKTTHTRERFTSDEVALIERAVAADDLLAAAWRRDRGVRMLRPDREIAAPGAPWAWKEPNTHVIVDRLRSALPNLRYVHVTRNGLDMAYSANQQQLRRWGESLAGIDPVAPSPRDALAYWCAVHRRIFSLAERMGDDFLAISYDRMCAEPATELDRLFAFAGCIPEPAQRAAAIASVHPPASIGRFRAHGLDAFDRSHIEYVERAGFAVH
jgi:hypothetical protein